MAVAAALRSRARRRLRERLRSQWGRPQARPREMALVAEYHRVLASGDAAPRSLDDRTWNDLHLDAVFAAIDHTASTVGQQALYHRLRTTALGDRREAFEALTQRAATDTAWREGVQGVMAHLADPAGYLLCTVAEQGFEVRPWHAVFPLLAVVMLAALVTAPFAPIGLLVAIVGVVVHLLVRIAVAPRLGAALALFRQVTPLLRAGTVLAASPTPGAETILGPLTDALPRLRRLGIVASWAGRDAAGSDLLGALLEYANVVFLLDANAYVFGVRELTRHAAAAVTVVGAVGEVDAALAVASFRESAAAWTHPRFGAEGTTIDLRGLRHPLLAAAVPNDLTLTPGAGLLLTGANMSGKSTLLRTVGLNVVLAQTINTCLATSYAAPPLVVRSLMGRADDLTAGKSYYLVEVEAVVEMLDRAIDGPSHLFLVDELFHGTNTIERVSAAAAVLGRIAGPVAGIARHVVIAATHDGELVDLLAGPYTPVHLADALAATGPVFDYRLRPGPATTRNAIALLRARGAPADVVQLADALADALSAARPLPQR